MIDRKLRAFNAVNIVGPKGCGKSTTAGQRCQSKIEFQNEDLRDRYLAIAETSPSLLLNHEKPILFDEWQDAPKIWGTIRKDCDDHPEQVGSYFLTGSTSKHVNTPHTGTGRITEITMFPMTLWESGESNGSVSLEKLFSADYSVEGQKTNCSLTDLFYSVCRGGWPRAVLLPKDEAALEIAKDYFNQIISKDISAFDGVKRNSETARLLIWSYARNMATSAKKKILLADVKASKETSDATLFSYIDVLEGLFVLKDIDAWSPQIRSKSSIRAAKKHVFLDPSIGLAALGIGPDYFYNDLDLFGHAFENLVLRDLLAYASCHSARVYHYHDDFGLEADAIYQKQNGDYALIEIKTGTSAIPAAEKNLLKFIDLIRDHNDSAKKDKDHPGVLYREPSVLMVICANADMAYTTKNGVKIIPVGCLKD